MTNELCSELQVWVDESRRAAWDQSHPILGCRDRRDISVRNDQGPQDKPLQLKTEVRAWVR